VGAAFQPRTWGALRYALKGQMGNYRTVTAETRCKISPSV
jgi:hypothetical protein